MFERLIFKHVFNHLQDIHFLTSAQSGFVPGDSTVNQLTFLYDTFCKALDDGLEVRTVFFDISKAFDKVWHKGLLHKLQSAGITESLYSWFKSYLSNRRQRVVLPGVESDWAAIDSGVPQGSILGPLLFLIFINDITSEINSSIRLFADDTSLYVIVQNPQVATSNLLTDIVKISDWADTWLVNFNPSKSETLLFSRKLNRNAHDPLYMRTQPIKEVNIHKHLGLNFASDCTWHEHIDYVAAKAWKRINIMRKLKFVLDRNSLEIIYFSFIRPILEYADVVWDNCNQNDKDRLEKIQHEGARIVSGATKLISICDLYNEVRWESLENRRTKHKLIMLYKMKNNLTPAYLSNKVPTMVGQNSQYSLRNSDDLQTIHSRTTLYYNSFLPSSIREWNTLSPEIQNAESVRSFKLLLNKENRKPPLYYYLGDRYSQVLHTRLRTQCSGLNHHLFLRNIVDSPLCACGQIENTLHYLLECPRYNDRRHGMLRELPQNIRLDTLLYGNPNSPIEENNAIFESVQQFIIGTKRFSSR